MGRRTAAAVMASYRPFENNGSSSEFHAHDAPTFLSSESEDNKNNASTSTSTSTGWEQETLLSNEEPEWHKAVRKRERVEGVESVWLDGAVLDTRIAERMRVFELTREQEAEAGRLAISPRDVEKEREREEAQRGVGEGKE